MKSALSWIWKRGIGATFLTGLFAILPIVITLAIISYLAGYLQAIVGADTWLGKALQWIGLGLVSDPTVATLIGGALVLVAIWLLGLFVRTTARHRFEAFFEATVERIPVVRTIYKPVAQVVGLLKGDGATDVKSMTAVFCAFGPSEGGGFLALLTSREVYRFSQQDCYAVYIPTSPIPMSGGIVFVPIGAVTTVEMKVDDLMKLYFSAGVLAPQVIPQQYRVKVEE